MSNGHLASLALPWLALPGPQQSAGGGSALPSGHDAPTPAPGAPPDRTEVGRPPTRPAASEQPGLLVVAAPQPSLIGTFHDVDETGLVVGRGSDAHVRIDDGGISRRHLRIARSESGDFFAQDLGSTNGSYVNGVRVKSARLAEGDRIQVGTGTEFLFGPRGTSPIEEVRLRQALAASGTGAWEWDVGAGALAMSGQFGRERVEGSESTEPPQDEIWQQVNPEDRARFRQRLEQLTAEGGSFELECRFSRREGGEGWMALRGQAFRDAAGKVVRIAGTAADVTRRRHAELEMRRQSLLIDSLSDGVVAIGFDGTILDWNASAEAMFGWTKVEALGRRPGELLSRGARMDVFTAEVLRRASRGERFAEERRLRRKDGTEIAVEVVAVPLRDPDGQEVASVAVLRDVDERRRIAAQLQVAERLASLGTLAAGVAHEINNPLAFIGANLSWARQRLSQVAQAIGPKWGDIESALTDCQEGAERIRTIVQDLKTYSAGEDRSESGPTDVTAVLEFALRMADTELRQRARLVRDLRPVPPVPGGHSRLGQVFLNLLVNAAQAIPPGRIAENEVRLRSRYDADAEAVVVEVEDTGAGIGTEDLARIFDPFFTTKPVGVGTGLGLFICHGIVTSLGGTLAVDSKQGAGTTFRVSLPVTAKPTMGLRPVRSRILFVDDEPLLGPSLQRYLSGRHEVVAVSDPREALRRVTAGEHFDLALLDVALPGMSGLELHEGLREVDPGLSRRTIFVHGGVVDPGAASRLEAANAPRVSKPFDLDRLGALIDAMLRDGR